MEYLALAMLFVCAIPFAWRLMGPPYGVFLIMSFVAPLAMFPTIDSQGAI